MVFFSRMEAMVLSKLVNVNNISKVRLALMYMFM